MDAQIGFFVYTRCHALKSSKYIKHTCIGLLCTHNNPLKHLCVHEHHKGLLQTHNTQLKDFDVQNTFIEDFCINIMFI
jgi:hypothetical protein